MSAGVPARVDGTLLLETSDRRRPQLQMAITGGPAGTGKSQVVRAWQWWGFQHDLLDRMAVLAYTRAADNVTTPVKTALSTCRSNFFGVHNRGPNKDN